MLSQAGRSQVFPTVLAALALGTVVSGCDSARSGAPPRHPVASWAQAPASGVAERFRPAAHPQLASTLLYLPGSQRQQLVSFQVVDGIAVMDGDIQLGPVAMLAKRYGAPWAGLTHVKSANTTTHRSHLWAAGVIPYSIDATVPPDQVENIGKAIVMVNRTELKVRPRTSADADYVVFSTSKGGCTSYLGRVGGMQDIQVGTCGPGSIAHEILHAAGFDHEQSRKDRDAFVTIMWDEIEPQYRFAFEKREGQADTGGYDYASVMHYDARAFSISGKPTIVPHVANAPIGQRNDLSAGDRAAITALYGGGGGVLPGGWSLPMPLPPLPGLPGASSASASACATGQVRDLLLQTCALACPSGSPPIAGACAPGGASPNAPGAQSPTGACTTPMDLLTGNCLPR